MTKPIIRVVQGLYRLGCRTAAWAEKQDRALLALIVALFALRQLARSTRRLWFDELFTFHIAGLPRISDMLLALPADGNPPLHYLMARGFYLLLGQNELAVRLPSVLGFSAALVLLFLYVRRSGGPVLALAAVLSLAGCGMADYAGEARPYGLMLGFTALALVSWQRAVDSAGTANRRWHLLGVAAGIAGASASHHYGIFHTGMALLCGEAVRLVQRRSLDWKLYAACAAGLSVLAGTLPLAGASQNGMLGFVRSSAVFWASPGLRNVRAYGLMFVLWLPLVAALLVWAFGKLRGSGEAGAPSRPAPAHELAAAAGLAALVPVMVIATWSATGYFVNRYAIGAALGCSILLAFAPGCLRLDSSRVNAAAALCLVPLAAYMMLARPLPAGQGTILTGLPGSGPVVIASAVNFLPAWWYAEPRVRPRLRYLADLPYAVRQADFLPEVSLVRDQPFLPAKVDEYQPFLRRHRRFLLYSEGPARLEWVKERLASAGWKLQLLQRKGSETLYQVDAPASEINP